MKTPPEARLGLAGRHALSPGQNSRRTTALIDKYPAYRKRAPVGPLRLASRRLWRRLLREQHR
jgi:hypothetical protein